MEDAVVFESEDYADACIGYSMSDGNQHAVYDYDKMIECLTNQGMSEEDAIEWIEYNTVRSIPYMGENAPIIINKFTE